jgi:hypothetical protein
VCTIQLLRLQRSPRLVQRIGDCGGSCLPPNMRAPGQIECGGCDLGWVAMWSAEDGSLPLCYEQSGRRKQSDFHKHMHHEILLLIQHSCTSVHELVRAYIACLLD